jgi:putative ABC transport system permease protein
LNWNTNVLGESPDYCDLRNWPVGRGAMFTWMDVERIAKVAVVGQTIVDELFPDGEEPLGQTVRIGNAPFRIIGVLERKGFSVTGSDQDDLIIIPYTSHLRRISRRDYVSSILVQVDDVGSFDAVEEQIDGLLYERHRLDEAEGPDFTVRTQLEIIEQATATTRTMTMLLAGIASVSLLVGGIGIMNIMLVSVSERTREIGIRLAIGAHDRDVLRQFLCEAVILSVTGGIIGVLVGVLASELLGRINGWPIDVSMESVLLATGFSAGVGIFFGFYPARSAARMDPIHALRYE